MKILGRNIKRVKCDCSYSILHVVCKKINGTSLENDLLIYHDISQNEGMSWMFVIVLFSLYINILLS